MNEQRIAALHRLIAKYQSELAVELAPKDTHWNGTVIMFSKRFGTSKWYSYAAIKADHKWYVTGTRGNSVYSWCELLDFASGNTIAVMGHATDSFVAP